MSPPSLWAHWSQIRKRLLKAKTLLVFLDYDGTLTPITSHPARARLLAKTRQLLKALSAQPGVWVALVSGRALRDLKSMVGLPGLCYVGNHGLELQGCGLRYINPAAQRAKPLMQTLARNLRSAFKSIPGSWVEQKSLSLSVHFRGVAPRDVPRARKRFHETVRVHRLAGKIRVTSGKKIFEVRPPIRWNKGTVVTWLLAKGPAAARGASRLPLYVGDDVTDEDAFRALGKKGITVAVAPRLPRTRAHYTLGSPQGVQRLLRLLLELQGSKRKP